MCVPRKNNREKWDKSQRLRIKKNLIIWMSERMAIVLYENKNGKKGTDETESLLGLERNIYIYY